MLQYNINISSSVQIVASLIGHLWIYVTAQLKFTSWCPFFPSTSQGQMSGIFHLVRMMEEIVGLPSLFNILERCTIYLFR